MKLYHCRDSRSFRCLWALEELAEAGCPVAYELTCLPFPPRIKQREYLDVNPLGTVPFLKDGDTEMTESSGICQYLVDRYGVDTGLTVSVEDAAYGAYLNWMYRSDATFTFPLAIVIRYGMLEKNDPAKAQVGEDYKKWFFARARSIESRLQDADYLVADRFTLADIAVSYCLYLGVSYLGLKDKLGPKSLAYLERLQARPGFKSAQERQADAPSLFG